jgi:hypothetical protein
VSDQILNAKTGVPGLIVLVSFCHQSNKNSPLIFSTTICRLLRATVEKLESSCQSRGRIDSRSKQREGERG